MMLYSNCLVSPMLESANSYVLNSTRELRHCIALYVLRNERCSTTSRKLLDKDMLPRNLSPQRFGKASTHAPYTARRLTSCRPAPAPKPSTCQLKDELSLYPAICFSLI